MSRNTKPGTRLLVSLSRALGRADSEGSGEGCAANRQFLERAGVQPDSGGCRETLRDRWGGFQSWGMRRESHVADPGKNAARNERRSRHRTGMGQQRWLPERLWVAKPLRRHSNKRTSLDRYGVSDSPERLRPCGRQYRAREG